MYTIGMDTQHEVLRAEIISDAEAERLIKVTSREHVNKVKTMAGMRAKDKRAEKSFMRLLTDELNH
mgnify:CR=1 FL=1